MSCSCINNYISCRPCYCGCDHSCGCQCCTPVNTITTTRSTTINPNPNPDTCNEVLDPRCIIYCGPDLPCYGIKTGDSAEDILNIIKQLFNQITPTTTTSTTVAP